MLKTILLTAGLVCGLLAAAPVYAKSSGGIPTGPGCTLNPFDHTWRCIDFDHCTTKADGTKDCPVTTGTYLAGATTGGHKGPAAGLHTRLPLAGLK